MDTPQVSNKGKDIHLRIEELDKKGKTLFKKKQYLEAAQIFTDALELIEAQGPQKQTSSLARQYITLVNNRSAMYEKGGVPDLALEDVGVILEKDPSHIKARTRRLRILESEAKWHDALVEMCALELQFMKDNRDKLRVGINVAPPVPHAKLEEILQKVIPLEVEKQMALNATTSTTEDYRPLPSKHTILQLLQSFTGYNTWMADAAKQGTVDSFTKELANTTDNIKKASLLYKRGRRYAYDRDYEACRKDFEDALALVQDEGDSMPGDEMARLLEWTGMVRHWSYNLDGATKCYERCSDLEPLNVRNECVLYYCVLLWILVRYLISHLHTLLHRLAFWSRGQVSRWTVEIMKKPWLSLIQLLVLIRMLPTHSCIVPISLCSSKSLPTQGRISNVVYSFVLTISWPDFVLLLSSWQPMTWMEPNRLSKRQKRWIRNHAKCIPIVVKCILLKDSLSMPVLNSTEPLSVILPMPLPT